MGMGFMFDIFPILFMVVFILILGVILISLGRGVSQWHKNNQSPVLTVQAEVVTKRADVRHHHHNTGGVGAMHTTSSTFYYATLLLYTSDAADE